MLTATAFSTGFICDDCGKVVTKGRMERVRLGEEAASKAVAG